MNVEMMNKYVVKHKSVKLFMTYAVGKLEATLNISHLIISTSSQRFSQIAQRSVSAHCELALCAEFIVQWSACWAGYSETRVRFPVNTLPTFPHLYECSLTALISWIPKKAAPHFSSSSSSSTSMLLLEPLPLFLLGSCVNTLPN